MAAAVARQRGALIENASHPFGEPDTLGQAVQRAAERFYLTASAGGAG